MHLITELSPEILLCWREGGRERAGGDVMTVPKTKDNVVTVLWVTRESTMWMNSLPCWCMKRSVAMKLGIVTWCLVWIRLWYVSPLIQILVFLENILNFKPCDSTWSLYPLFWDTERNGKTKSCFLTHLFPSWPIQEDQSHTAMWGHSQPPLPCRGGRSQESPGSHRGWQTHLCQLLAGWLLFPRKRESIKRIRPDPHKKKI